MIRPPRKLCSSPIVQEDDGELLRGGKLYTVVTWHPLAASVRSVPAKKPLLHLRRLVHIARVGFDHSVRVFAFRGLHAVGGVEASLVAEYTGGLETA